MLAVARCLLVGCVVSMALAGCSRPPVDGTIYVIKGGGNIVRAAAVNVHAVPYESVEAFENARRDAFQRSENDAVEQFLAEACRTFEASRADTLQRKLTEMDALANECASARARPADTPIDQGASAEDLRAALLEQTA